MQEDRQSQTNLPSNYLPQGLGPHSPVHMKDKISDLLTYILWCNQWFMGNLKAETSSYLPGYPQYLSQGQTQNICSRIMVFISLIFALVSICSVPRSSHLSLTAWLSLPLQWINCTRLIDNWEHVWNNGSIIQVKAVLHFHASMEICMHIPLTSLTSSSPFHPEIINNSQWHRTDGTAGI